MLLGYPIAMHSELIVRPPTGVALPVAEVEAAQGFIAHQVSPATPRAYRVSSPLKRTG